jgi:hypothetical protein
VPATWNNIYGGNGVGLFAQEYGFNSDNAVVVNRLYYSFPVGDQFTVVGGPVVRMDDMLPVWPSAYPSDMTMDFFTYAGAPGAYNLTSAVVLVSTGRTKVVSAFPPATSLTNGNLSDPNAGGVATDAAGTVPPLRSLMHLRAGACCCLHLRFWR